MEVAALRGNGTTRPAFRRGKKETEKGGEILRRAYQFGNALVMKLAPYIPIERNWPMAKYSQDPIAEVALNEFVANDSDVAFEVQVLATLRRLHFECLHSGTYQDPISQEIRQLDIRASTTRDRVTLALAVECRNLRANHPLLLSAVPQTE